MFAYVTVFPIVDLHLPHPQLLLHIFLHDDTRGFQALGSATNLYPWYGDGLSIHHACFVSGSEELLLVDSQARARIFSLVTLQFRYVWSLFVCLCRSY